MISENLDNNNLNDDVVKQDVSSDKIEYYIARSAPGKEEKFMDSLDRALRKKENHGIYSFFRPESVKGYVFVEAINLNSVVDAVRGIPNSKGVIRQSVDFAELEKYFDKEGEKIIVNEKDIVEIVSGPFKGDKAKVIRIIASKDEVVIEPLSAAVPIPITLSMDDIRVLKSIEEN